MNPEQFQQWINLQERQAIALEKIAQLLARSLPRQPAPNYKAILEQFNEYDWSSINAQVELTDQYGVSSVIWQGDRYKRRSPNNKYGAVIYFSRAVGKDERGNTQYERLITFEPFANLTVERISPKAESIIKS